MEEAKAIGRPVRVMSLSFPFGIGTEAVATLAEREARSGVDLIALPETWTGQGGHVPETFDGPTLTAMGKVAANCRAYVVCPLDRAADGKRLNSAVLLDRRGRIVCVYDKVYPYWSEFDVVPRVQPGLEVPVYQADFGRIGMAICFDVNFPEVWQRLADGGAELVVWPSAYSAGTSLQAHALNHHYYIVTSTWNSDCLVWDITGRRILHESSAGVNVTRITLDLDRGIYHENFNMDKLHKLLAEHPEDVGQELHMPLEQWSVLRAKRPGVSARALARQYGLEELNDYLRRSRREIDAMRGGPISPSPFSTAK